MDFCRSFLGLSVVVVVVHICDLGYADSYVSAIGDPEMKNPNSRFAFEAWNFCNEVGTEAPNMGSPRLADCADLHASTSLTGFPHIAN